MNKITNTTEAQRHANLEQALANTRIEGHVPCEEFAADVDAVARGEMSADEAREASLRRALEADAKSQQGGGNA
jgi:hypothetical protein